MRVPVRTKHLLIAVGVVVGLVGGGAAIATATSAPDGSDQSQSGTDQQGNVQDPSYHSSVTVAEAQDQGSNENDEATQLQSLAKISADDAKAAALAAVPGTAKSAELENENGNVVYGVQVVRADGTTVDVKIDAGNGAVLAQDDGGADSQGSAQPGANQEQGNNQEQGSN